MITYGYLHMFIYRSVYMRSVLEPSSQPLSEFRIVNRINSVPYRSVANSVPFEEFRTFNQINSVPYRSVPFAELGTVKQMNSAPCRSVPVRTEIRTEIRTVNQIPHP